MQIVFLASQSHYQEHLEPIHKLLPASELRSSIHDWSAIRRSGQYTLLVAAAPVDLRNAAHGAPNTPLVIMEHGAGQMYKGVSTTWQGPGTRLTNRATVVLGLMPGEPQAEHWRRYNPRIPVSVVGCPKLDKHHLAPKRKTPRTPTVVLSGHWDAKAAPETRSAWPHYQHMLEALRDGPWKLVGHHHPKDLERAAEYKAAGIPVWASFDKVLAQGDLYITDNSSTLYEFASLGRPVVALNAPWYRREISHGLRFWDAIPGLQVDEPEQLLEQVGFALQDAPWIQRIRSDAIAKVYTYTDGLASERAAKALLKVVSKYER